MNETTHPLVKVIHEYRNGGDMTYRAFAYALNEHLVNTGVSHQSISNWEKGNTEPDTDFLLTCLVVHRDWRRQFAIDCLCAKLPEVFERVDNSIRLLIRPNVAGRRPLRSLAVRLDPQKTGTGGSLFIE